MSQACDCDTSRRDERTRRLQHSYMLIIMAPKRKREAASQQENAPERQLRSGKSTALPSNGSPRKSPRKPRSRSPRKKAVKAIIETQDEDDEDNDDNEGKPFKARKLSPPEPLVQKKTRQAAGTLQEDVNSLLEEIPSGKPLKRQRHSSPDKGAFDYFSQIRC